MRVWLVTLGAACVLIILAIGWLKLGLPSTDAAPNGALMRMWVTAYSSCVYDIRIIKPCDGITASGRRVEWGTVACGPGYPFGTVFEVPGVGRMTCWDRGGGVANHMIDIWFPEEAQAWRFGAKWMDVRVYSSSAVASAPARPAPVAAPAPAPRPAPIAVPPGGTTYTVVAGDTLGVIAQRHGSDVQTVAQANNIDNPNLIHVGQTLVIPGRGEAPSAAAQPAEQATGGAGGESAPANAAAPTQPAPAPVQAATPAPTAPTPASAAVVQAPPPEEAPLTRLTSAAPRGVPDGSLGNLLADSLRAQYQATVGLAAGRDVRANLAAGPVRAAQVTAVFAANHKSLTQDLRGETLRRALEHSLSQPEGWEGALYVAGLSVGYDPDAPAGRRVTRLSLADGRPVVDKAWYRVALTEGVYFALGYTAILEEGKGLIAYQPLDALMIHALGQRDVVQPPQDRRWIVTR